jgi:hypothetical protein
MPDSPDDTTKPSVLQADEKGEIAGADSAAPGAI